MHKVCFKITIFNESGKEEELMAPSKINIKPTEFDDFDVADLKEEIKKISSPCLNSFPSISLQIHRNVLGNLEEIKNNYTLISQLDRNTYSPDVPLVVRLPGKNFKLSFLFFI
jgi:hypothetical protein